MSPAQATGLLSVHPNTRAAVNATQTGSKRHIMDYVDMSHRKRVRNPGMSLW